MRRGFIDGAEVFGVDYQICRRCRLGWVEEPYTEPRYQRHGIAVTALAALRVENPGIAWHTAGGHLAGEFWQAAGDGISGAYRQRGPCAHVALG